MPMALPIYVINVYLALTEEALAMNDIGPFLIPFRFANRHLIKCAKATQYTSSNPRAESPIRRADHLQFDIRIDKY
jgi:hypothetical protein